MAVSAPEAASANAETGVVTNSRRALFTVVAVVFVDLLGFGVVIPILPYYVRSFGVSDVYIGLLAASYSLCQFVFAPLLGRLSDERSRRPVLMISVDGNAVAWTLFGLGADFESAFGVVGALGVLFFARMLAGAMGGNISTAQAYIADVTPADRRAGALGLIGAAFGLGFVFGPAIGGAFASDPVVAAARDVLPAFVPATRFSLPSFAAACLSGLACVATFLFLEEPARHRAPAARRGLLRGFVEAVRSSLRPYVSAFLLASLAFSGVQVVFIPFVADAFGYDAAGTALLLTYIGVVGVINQGVVVRRLSARYRDDHLAVAGALGLVAALAVLPFTPALGTALAPVLAGLSGVVRRPSSSCSSI